MTQVDGEINSIYATPLEQRVVFFLVTVGVFTLTFGIFFIIDFLPEKPETKSVPSEVVIEEVALDEEDTNKVIDPYPTRIIFDSLDREVAVVNPESRSVAALDTALLSGAVRHPDSADFENKGTIFLFGHSSYLPNVINKNFQAFNGIQKLTWGDTIRLQSSDTEYLYRVDRVYEASANDAEVKIETGESKLTLVTCDSFGSKADRFIVEATLVETTSLGTKDVDNI